MTTNEACEVAIKNYPTIMNNLGNLAKTLPPAALQTLIQTQADLMKACGCTNTTTEVTTGAQKAPFGIEVGVTTNGTNTSTINTVNNGMDSTLNSFSGTTNNSNGATVTGKLVFELGGSPSQTTKQVNTVGICTPPSSSQTVENTINSVTPLNTPAQANTELKTKGMSK